MLVKVQGPRAKVTLRHERPVYDESTGLWVNTLLDEQEAWNIVTDTGRRQLHRYLYGAGVQRSSLGGGFNYIAISSNASAPANSDTVLTGEILIDGLNRQLATVVLPTGSGTQTLVSKVFTYTGAAPLAVRKTALFDAPTGGVMAHEIQFSSRTLFQNDNFTLSFAITFA
jgi:hypothetical protein